MWYIIIHFLNCQTMRFFWLSFCYCYKLNYILLRDCGHMIPGLWNLLRLAQVVVNFRKYPTGIWKENIFMNYYVEHMIILYMVSRSSLELRITYILKYPIFLLIPHVLDILVTKRGISKSMTIVGLSISLSVILSVYVLYVLRLCY